MGRESIIAICIIVFCFVNYFYLIPSQVIIQGSKSTYPLIVNTFILISSIGYFIQSIYYYHRKSNLLQEKKADKSFSETPTLNEKNINRSISIFVMLLVVIWILLLNYIGFIISTILFLIGAISLCSESRNYIKIFSLSFLFTIFLYFLFRIVLKTILPEGFLEIFIENYL